MDILFFTTQLFILKNFLTSWKFLGRMFPSTEEDFKNE